VDLRHAPCNVETACLWRPGHSWCLGSSPGFVVGDTTLDKHNPKKKIVKISVSGLRRWEETFSRQDTARSKGSKRGVDTCKYKLSRVHGLLAPTTP
jgi:hypothetical protein